MEEKEKKVAEIYFPEEIEIKEKKEEELDFNQIRVEKKIIMPPESIIHIGQGGISSASPPKYADFGLHSFLLAVGPEKVEGSKVGVGLIEEKSKNTQIELQHQSGLSILQGAACQFQGRGNITSGGTTLTSLTNFNWTTDELKNYFVNLLDSETGLIVENAKILSNTANTITVNKNWTSSTAVYHYVIYRPVILGSVNHPWLRMYIGDDIRFGRYVSTASPFVEAAIKFGSGSPEGAVTAPPGSLYLRTDGGAGTTLYVKESGTGNTGWVAIKGLGSEISQDLIPSADNTYKLGSAAKKWQTLYIKEGFTDGEFYAYKLSVGSYVGSNLNPDINENYSVGSSDRKWLNGYFKNMYTGDLKFGKDEVYFKLDEDSNFLNFYNNKNELIMKLSSDGDIYIKGKIKKI